MTDLELGWIVGLFEGEGSISISKYKYVTLELKMVDEDIVRRFYSIVKVGYICGPIIDKRLNSKSLWLWRLSTKFEIIRLLTQIFPLLGKRRSLKAIDALLTYGIHINIKNYFLNSDLKLGWIAGIFEGEGCISINKTNVVSLLVSMTDKDIIDRFYLIAGVGYIYGPIIDKRPNHKIIWRWILSTKFEVEILLKKLFPLLGNRRKLKTFEALTIKRKLRTKYKIPLKTECIRGHLLNFSTTNSHGKYRECKECKRLRKLGLI